METIREENPTIRENSTIRETLNTPKINVSSFRDYEVIEELDNIGAEADIYIIQKNNQKYFLKLYRKGIELKDDIFEKIKNIDSEYFIKLIEYGFDETTQRFYEISEYIKAQTLNKNIDIDYFIKALNEALNILHQNQIIHHDLKPNNILVLNSKIKLIDFGVSTILENEFTKKLTSIKGTYSYFSPESISGYVGKEIDYWSFGIIVLELLDKNPFTGLNQTTIIHYLATKPIPIPSNLPQKYQILLKGLLTKDPHKRWGYNEIKLWLENRFSNIYYEEIELPKYKFNNQELILQELAQQLLKTQNFELAQKHIARGYITKFLEKIEDFDFVIKLDEYEKVVEKLIYFCYSQNPTLPFSLYGKIIDEEFIFNLFLKKMKNNLDEIDNKILDTLLQTDTIIIYEQTTNNQTNLKEFISKFNINNLKKFFRVENILKEDEKIVSLMFKYIQKDKLFQYDIKSILDYAIQKDNIQIFSDYYKLYKADFSKYLEYIYNNGLDFNIVINSKTPNDEIIKFLINKDKNLILKYFNKNEIVEFLKDNLEYTKELFEFVKDEDLSDLLDILIDENNIEMVKFLLDKNLKQSKNNQILSFLIKNSLLDKYKHIITYENIKNDYGIKDIKLKQTLEGQNSITLTKDDKYIVSKSNDNTIKIWDIETGECIKTLEGQNSITLTKDNKYIVSGSRDNTIKIWDIETGECIKTLEGHTDSVSSVILTKDDKYIIPGNWFGAIIKIWDFDSGKCIKTLEGHTSFINSITLTKDNQYIISGNGAWEENGTIKIWDIETGECIKTLEGHTWSVNSVILTKDDKYIISGSNDNTIKIWDFDSGKCIKTLEGHTRGVNSVILTKDNKYIVSGSRDNTIKIWDIETGECIKTLEGHTDHVNSVILTKDDKYIISGSWNNTIKIWEIKKSFQDYLYQFNYDILLNILKDKLLDFKEVYENLYHNKVFNSMKKLALTGNYKNELLKFLLENNSYQQIDNDLYNFIDLEKIDYNYLEQLIRNNLLPEKINFKYISEKIYFIKFLLNKNKNLIKKYFDIETILILISKIENKQQLFSIFSEEEKKKIFDKLKNNNIPLLVELYKNEEEYLIKLKQILKNTKDKEIKELFYTNGIKLSLSEKLFGIKE